MQQLTFGKLAAIFPLNELYFLASQEQVMRGTPESLYKQFPITHLVSRKVQQNGKEYNVDWRGDKKPLPWEAASYVDLLKYGIHFDCNNPRHTNWSLQETAKRCRRREIKAVFVDSLSLRFRLPTDPKRSFYEATFECTPIPKRSDETLKEVQGMIRGFAEKYGLYPEISKRDRKFFARIYEHPSCLDLKTIMYTPNPRIQKPSDKTTGILNATDLKTQLFFFLLEKVTAHQVKTVRKKLDKVEGFIFDGIVSSETIEEMLKRENY